MYAKKHTDANCEIDLLVEMLNLLHCYYVKLN
jgi:hypothetical protein